MVAKAHTRLDTLSPMTSPAQLERLSEHLRKLRLLKCGERLEALLQHAASQELPYADFLEQVLGEEVAAKTTKNIAMRTAMARFPFVKPLETFDFAYRPSVEPVFSVPKTISPRSCRKHWTHLAHYRANCGGNERDAARSLE